MAVYVTFEGQKLWGQFSENLVLRIYEFLFNSGGKISKEKRIMKVLRIKNENMTEILNLLIVYFH